MLSDLAALATDVRRPTRQHTGRRRNAAARDATLQAAFELLRTEGAGGLTIDAIAEAAGVGRQTIYRWWPSKGAVMAEAMVRGAGAIVPVHDSGSLPDAGAARDLGTHLIAAARRAGE
jgi:AcrR family transcriptional regulator